jgi:hypothetical protein
MDGASVSFTVMSKPPESELDEASVAVQFTVVVPSGNVEPEGGAQTTVTPEQLSVAVAPKFTTASHCPGSVDTTVFEGVVSTGASVSFTVMLNPVVPVLPAASVAVQEMGVVPTGKKPGTGLQETVVPGQLSFAAGGE